MEKKRLLWADIAKCIAIIAVLLGHTSSIPSIVSHFCFSFHMPIFFLLSGYFMKPTEPIKLAKKDAKALLLPYCLTCLMMIILAVIKAVVSGNSAFEAAKKWLFASLYGSGGNIADWAANTRWIGAIWFLLALFTAKAVVNYTAKFKYQFIYIAVIAYIGYATKEMTWLPLSIQPGLTASLFVYIGTLLKKYDVFNTVCKSGYLPVRVFSLFTWVFCIFYCGKMYLVGNTFNNGYLDIIGSICATICIVRFCMFIENHILFLAKPLAFIGSATLAILCCHILELNLFPWALIYNFLGGKPNWVIMFVLRLALVSVMTTLLYFIPYVNKVFFSQLKKNK